jgi:hypothetical protein
VGLAVLVIGTCAWLAIATPLFEKIGSGLMFKSPGGGPLVTYGEPGKSVEAVLWQPTGSTNLKVYEVQRGYLLDDGREAQAAITVSEDSSGNRWLQAAEGTSGLVPSLDCALYFFQGGRQLYLVDARSLEITPLTSWEYNGKSVYRLAEEQSRSVHWVYRPLWAPDGRSVVFGTDRSGENEIWRVSAIDRRETVLASSDAQVWLPRFWADDGRLVIQHMQEQAGSDFLLLDTQSGAVENLLHATLSSVSPPFIVTYDDVEQTHGLLLYDVNSRTSVALPPTPNGHMYQFPLVVSPGGTRLAAWLSSKQGTSLLGIVDLVAEPTTILTYPEPQGAHGSGGLMWLSDDTVAVQCGDKNLPGAATFALKVGGAK